MEVSYYLEERNLVVLPVLRHLSIVGNLFWVFDK